MDSRQLGSDVLNCAEHEPDAVHDCESWKKKDNPYGHRSGSWIKRDEWMGCSFDEQQKDAEKEPPDHSDSSIGFLDFLVKSFALFHEICQGRTLLVGVLA